MKPRLRSDTLYLPVEDGTYLLNNRDTLVLSGRHIYSWLERVHPLLDGSRSLEEILAPLPPEKRAFLRDLVMLLADRGFVKDAAPDRPHGLTPAELDTFAAEIAFIDYFVDSAAARFEQVRQARCLAVGSGNTFVALVRSLAQLGFRTVRGRDLVPGTAEEGWLDEVLRAATGRDPALRVSVEPGPPDAAEIGHADLVFYAADRPDAGECAVLDAACRDAGRFFGAVLVLGDTAIVGPFSAPAPADTAEPGEPGAATVSWRDLWERLRRNAWELTEQQPGASVSAFLTVPTASIAASQLAFEAMKRVAEIPALELGDSILHLDLVTLHSETHRVTPAITGASGRPPATPPRHGETRDGFERRVALLATGEPVDAGAFSERMRPQVDRYAGLLQDIDERDLVQLPLNVSEARVGVPDEGGAFRVAAVLGCGFGIAASRERAARLAVHRYARSALDHRRYAAVGYPALWGHDTRARDAVPVPLDVLRSPACTVVSGDTWEDAILAALLERYVARARAGAPELCPLPDELVSDPGNGRAVGLLARTGCSLRLYDLGLAPTVPAVVVCVDGEDAGSVAGPAWPAVVVAALERALAWWQGRMQGIALVEPPAGVVSFGERAAVPAWADGSDVAPPDPATIPAATILAALPPDDTPVLVPLDHDPAVRAACPYVAGVVDRATLRGALR